MALIINLNPTEQEKANATPYNNTLPNDKIWVEGAIYGGQNATVKGEWVSDVITIDDKDSSHQVLVTCFKIDGKNVDTLSMNFLRIRPETDTEGKQHIPSGSVRSFIKQHSIGNDREKLMKSLADELNKRGLKVTLEHFEKWYDKNGESRRWTTTLYHLHFGDDKL